MNVLIIEDEPFAQQELMRLLKSIDEEIRVIRCVDSVEESVHFLQGQEQPDLIFMDIQLSDGLSFEIFDRITVQPPVIFTTAFDDYAIKAFKVNSIDYLLKPIEEEDLAKAIKKFRKSTLPGNEFFSRQQLEEVLGLYRPAYKSRLVVKLGDKIRHIEAEEIAYFFSEDKVSFLVTNDSKKYIINYSLEQIEKFMNPGDFYRLNRKYIARINAIETIDKYFNSRLKIGLKPDVIQIHVLWKRKILTYFM